MATMVKREYGALGGTDNSKFRAVAEIWDYGVNSTGDGRLLTLYRYIEVTQGDFHSTIVQISWGSGETTISGIKAYAHHETSQYSQRYGTTLSFPASDTKVYYDSVSTGIRRESSTEISYTVPKPSYTVSYNANGGTGAPDAQSKFWGDNLTLSSTIPTKTGHTFKGWSIAVDTTVEYSAGDVYGRNSDAILYAVWEPTTYKVTYNGNGGLWNGQPTWTANVKYKESYVTEVNFFVRPGWKFLGWNESPDGNGTDWTSYIGKPWTYTYTKDVTLYAIWKRNGQLNIHQNGVFKKGQLKIKDGGVWKIGLPWIKVNGTWKRGGL